jgi:hypothetical protein
VRIFELTSFNNFSGIFKSNGNSLIWFRLFRFLLAFSSLIIIMRFQFCIRWNCYIGARLYIISFINWNLFLVCSIFFLLMFLISDIYLSFSNIEFFFSRFSHSASTFTALTPTRNSFHLRWALWFLFIGYAALSFPNSTNYITLLWFSQIWCSLIINMRWNVIFLNAWVLFAHFHVSNHLIFLHYHLKFNFCTLFTKGLRLLLKIILLLL